MLLKEERKLFLFCTVQWVSFSVRENRKSSIVSCAEILYCESIRIFSGGNVFHSKLLCFESYS